MAGVCTGNGAGAVVRATSRLLPVPLAVPTVAVVKVPASSASWWASISLSFPLPLSFCVAMMLVPVPDGLLDGLAWAGFEDWGGVAWLRMAAGDA